MRRMISVTWQQLLFITAMLGLGVYIFKKNKCSPTGKKFLSVSVAFTWRKFIVLDVHNFN